jgi:hypothetical protein
MADDEYGAALVDLMEDFKTKVQAADDIPSRLKQSLLGQIGHLKRESIGQGLRNLCEDHLVD